MTDVAGNAIANLQGMKIPDNWPAAVALRDHMVKLISDGVEGFQDPDILTKTLMTLISSHLQVVQYVAELEDVFKGR